MKKAKNEPEEKVKETKEKKKTKKINNNDKTKNIQKEKIVKEDLKTVVIPKKIVTKRRVLLALALIIFAFSIIFSLLNMTNDKSYKNISVQGIDISEIKIDEAKARIEKIFNQKKSNQIKLKHGDYETSISYEQINVTEKINQAVEQAFSTGRSGNIFTNNYTILSTYFINRDIPLEITIDEKNLENVIADIESKLPDVETENNYYIEDDNLIIKSGTAGVKIIKEELKKKIVENINNFSSIDSTIEIPIKEVEPQDIDIEKIEQEISKSPKDAYISENPFEVHAEESGVELAISTEEAKEILKEEKDEYTIPLKITPAEITVASLGEEAFTDRLATFTTNYDASNLNRNNNLVLAARKLDGKIVNPGEVFSYNQTIGQRTISAGFKEAGAYAGGTVVMDVGGGICQLSSTLYNAALLTNLDIVERHNHYFQTSYVAAGRDATVSWGTLDFKFKNNRNYPIKIEASAGDGVVTVTIYGIKQEDDYTVLIESNITNIIEKKMIYQEDKSLQKGEEVIQRKGEDGCTSETYKILLRNGIIASKTVISKDTYNPLAGIIRRNSK